MEEGGRGLLLVVVVGAGEGWGEDILVVVVRGFLGGEVGRGDVVGGVEVLAGRKMRGRRGGGEQEEGEGLRGREGCGGITIYTRVVIHYCSRKEHIYLNDYIQLL